MASGMRSLLGGVLLVLGVGVGGVVLVPARGAAQAEAGAAVDTVYRVRLVDGSTVFGRVLESSETRIVLVSEGGARFEIERSQIRDIEALVGRVVNGEVWAEDANRTRLFFGPTGRALGSGEGYVGLYELFFSFVAVGVGDRVTLAAGTPIIPEAMGEVFYFAPKITLVNEPRFQLAAGALSFFATREIDEGSVGIVYGVGTFGDSDDAVSLGAGWGFALGGDDAAVSDEPVLMLGLERRTGRSLKMLSENYFVSGNALLSGGLRFLGERFSADVGLGAGLGTDDSFCCLPILTAAYRF